MAVSEERTVETNVPQRLDRLPWSRWHWLIVTALGITWLLDGLEVTLAGTLGGVLKRKDALGLTDAQVGLSASSYLAGAVIGALVFGYLTDRLGRKKLFTWTLLLYLVATAATALSRNFTSYALFRALTGAGIGGEYAAVNSAIDELIPARVRGRVDLMINGTFWLGAALGALGSILLLNQSRLPTYVSWRFAFGIGAVLGAGVLVLRRYVPESPRWLMLHARAEEAERIVGGIEKEVAEKTGRQLPPAKGSLKLCVRERTPFREIWNYVWNRQRTRSLLGLVLMTAQAFFYNAVFFTYALVLVDFYKIPAEQTGWYMLALALGNFAGPLLLGRLFDTVGRKPMIVMTYGLSGALLMVSGYLFARNLLDVRTQAIAWTVIFFIASSAASSAYLTVSEVFPLEIRSLAIAFFYACGTLAGGVAGPALFGRLIQTHDRVKVFYGYALAGALMIGAAVVEAVIGVAAERKALEDISEPLGQRR
jgi:MFS family permease